MSSFVSTIYTEIVTAFSSQTGSMAKSFANAIKPVYIASVGLYVVYLVYRFNNDKDMILQNIINTIVVFVIVGAFTFSNKWYYDSVIPFVQNSGDELAKAIIGKTAKSSKDVIDAVVKGFIDARVPYWDMWDKGGVTNVKLLYEGGVGLAILYIAEMLFSIAIAVNLILAKIMVNLLLTVGVLFIGFSLFPATRSMFQQFTGMCLNYILLNVLYSAAVVMTYSFIDDRLKTPGGTAYISLLVGTIIIVFSLNQIPTLVSSITGGVGISPFTAGGLIKGTLGTLGQLKRDSGLRNFFQGKRSAADRGQATGNLASRITGRLKGKGNSATPTK